MKHCYHFLLAILLVTVFFNPTDIFTQQPQEVGQWSDPIPFNLVPVAVANLPDGRLLTWSSRFRESRFDAADGFTYTEIYDPSIGANGQSMGLRITDNNHNMFCPGINNLADGRILVAGGGSAPRTTIYDPQTETWLPSSNMNVARAYQGNVTLANGEVFTIGGQWDGGSNGKIGEVWTLENGWKSLPGIPMEILFNANDLQGRHNRPADHAWVWGAPNGKVFHAGPSEDMHWLDINGNGSYTFAGKRADDVYSISGTTVMYDIGKILKVGGSIGYGNGTPASERSYIIDINDENNVSVTPTSNNIAFSRTHHNSVVLPNGEVMIVGGLSTARTFFDGGSRFQAEIWSPETNRWRTVAGMQVPRNYHSVSILMMDGRIFSGGGGLCGGCSVNHEDAEIYSPPYLFDSNGNLAARPEISAPATAQYNQTLAVESDDTIQAFSFIRMSSATHSVNNEQRRVPVTFSRNGSTYSLNVPNANIMPPGYYMLFAMDQNGVPSIAEAVQVLPGFISVTDVALNTDDIELSEGRRTSLLPIITPSSATDQSVNWRSADTNVATVDVNGNITAVGIGTTIITVTTNDGGFTAQTSVTVVESDGLCSASGTILMERYDAIAGVLIDELLNSPSYPNSPTATQELDLFEIPANVADNYGVRVRGYLCAPETGTYYFWVSGDDESRFNISTDNNPSNIATVASIPNWTASREWNKYPQQKSIGVQLVQGLSYYVEGFMKEGGGGDNLAVGWRKPSDGDGVVPVEVIPGSVLSPVQPCYSSTGPPVATVSVTDATCDVTTGALTFSFPDNPGRTGIEFSIDGGVSFPYQVADNSGSTIISDLDQGTYNLWVRWGNNECPLELGGYTIDEDCTIIPVTGVEVDPITLTLIEGETESLVATVSPVDATDTSINWSSSDMSVATVDSNGQVTAINAGTVTITVTTNDGGFEATSDITVERTSVPVAGVVLNTGSLDLTEGETVNLTATVSPSDADDTSVVWTSSNENIATVDSNGRITAVSEGFATITVTTNDGGFEDQAEVTVSRAEIPRPTQSSPLLVDTNTRRVWVVNPDNNSVSVLNSDTLELLGEFAVADDPISIAKDAQANIWVTCRDTGVIEVLNSQGNTINTINLGRGSQPYGVVNDPEGEFLYVSLFASNKVLKIDAENQTITDELTVFSRPRAMAISSDGSYLFVTQFITENNQGRIAKIDLQSFGLASNVIVEADTFSANTSLEAKGIANYLGGVAIQPNTDKAWFTAKKDNTLSGAFRSGENLNFATTVRAMVSTFSMESAEENVIERVDIDNHNLPTAITLSPDGRYVFVTMLTNNRIVVLDANTGLEVTRRDVGFAPSGVVVDPTNNHLFVKNFLSRSVHVFDADGLISEGNRALPLLSEVNTVSNEVLGGQVLQGKQIFYNARDSRMTQQENSDAGYISCASCHIDGTHDGQTWDFTQRGEGLRNTISLRGRAGTGHGNVHWTGNFDEIHDFENDIRFAFGGTGFMNDQDFFSENRENPLSGSKAGRSPELDALNAYIESLNSFDESPNKNENGTMTSAALQGKALFNSLQCANCHSGETFTNSPSGLLHDIGTLAASSGSRLGRALQGLDVPTLRDVWATAPYLHDGSAATVKDAIARHTIGNNLSQSDLDLLEAYVLQLDGFEAPANEGITFELQVPSTANFEEPVTLSIASNITNISEVIYYADDIEIGRSSNAPYNLNFSPDIANNYCIYAKAVHQGMATISQNQTLSIIAPLNNSNNGRLLTLEGEDFASTVDGRVGNYIAGFQGTGFLDLGANNSYGEWQFESAEDIVGSLSIVFNSGFIFNRLATVELNGEDLGEVEFNSSANCFAWQSLPLENISIREGLNTIRITMTSIFGGVDIDYLEIELPEIIIPVNGVAINPTELTLIEGASSDLTAMVTPQDATDKGVTWSSSDENVVTVNNNGSVSAVGEGSAIITVRTNDGGLQASSNVTVERATISVTGVISSPVNLTLTEGETENITATVSPSNADNRSVIWSSSDEGIALVDNNGDVTAINPGTAVITVTTIDGNFSSTTEIEVVKRVVPVTGIVLDVTEGTVPVGFTGTITATVFPEDATNKTVFWTSSNENVATVDQEGNVLALAPGNVIITATTEDGGFSATVNGTIEGDEPGPIPVTGVTLEPNELALKVGDISELTAFISPENADDTSVVWSSTTESVAVVDDNGIVTAIAEGSAIITVSTNDGGFEAYTTITVQADEPGTVPVSGISVTPALLNMFEGQSLFLEAEVMPSNASDKTVLWSSEDENTATVSENGQVFAVDEGVTIISALTNDGGFEARISVEVAAEQTSIPVTGIVLDVTEGEVPVGFTGTIEATVLPENATDKRVEWESNNQKVGIVNQDGDVEAVGPGTVIITARTVDGGYSATVVGTVFESSSGFSVRWGEDNGFSVNRPMVFPNPSDGIINLDLRFYEDIKLTVVVFNNLQQRVFQIDYPENHSVFEELNLGNLSNGVYHIVFEANGEKETQTIIISK